MESPPLLTASIWGHSDNLDVSVTYVSYSDLGDNEYDEVDRDISIDPEFVNPALRDYHVLASSPVIDAGNSTNAFLQVTDIDGES